MELQSDQDMGQAMDHVTRTLRVPWPPTRHISDTLAITVTMSSFFFRYALLFDHIKLTASKTVHSTREKGRRKIFLNDQTTKKTDLILP